MGEQVSNLPPHQRRAWDIYGIKKQVGLRNREKRKGKGNWCSMHIYLSYMLLGGMHIQR